MLLNLPTSIMSVKAANGIFLAARRCRQPRKGTEKGPGSDFRPLFLSAIQLEASTAQHTTSTRGIVMAATGGGVNSVTYVCH